MNEVNRICLNLEDRELKAGPTSFEFSASFSKIDDNGNSKPIDTQESVNSATFAQNYKYWNQETRLLSTNNLVQLFIQIPHYYRCKATQDFFTSIFAEDVVMVIFKRPTDTGC